MEEIGLRWRGAIADGGDLSLVKGSGLRCRGAIAGGGEQSQVEGSGLKRRGAGSGGSGLRWRGAGELTGFFLELTGFFPQQLQHEG